MRSRPMDDLDDLLTPGRIPPEPPALRAAIERDVSRVLSRRRVFGRVRRVALLAACYAAGMASMWLWSQVQRPPRPEVVQRGPEPIPESHRPPPNPPSIFRPCRCPSRLQVILSFLDTRLKVANPIGQAARFHWWRGGVSATCRRPPSQSSRTSLSLITRRWQTVMRLASLLNSGNLG